MEKGSDKEFTVECQYKEDGEDIMQILKTSLLIYIDSEVDKLCCQIS